jgi:hypothetical protein
MPGNDRPAGPSGTRRLVARGQDLPSGPRTAERPLQPPVRGPTYVVRPGLYTVARCPMPGYD